jgi:hypothetical protein
MSRQLTAASLRLPYPPYLWKVVRGSVVMWLLARVAYAGLMAALELFGLLPPDEGIALALHPGWPARGALVTLAAGLVWWDRRRAHELLLHDNMGAWRGWFWTASLLAGLVLDAGIQTVLGAVL